MLKARSSLVINLRWILEKGRGGGEKVKMGGKGGGGLGSWRGVWEVEKGGEMGASHQHSLPTLQCI